MTDASPDALLEQCRGKANLFSDKEIEFLRSINSPFALSTLSPAQKEWLSALADREALDFNAINSRALPVLHSLCERWIGGGVKQGKEYVVRNPMRADGKAGSFRINLENGKWADFAIDGVRGGDPISLAAYLFHANDQVAAAKDVKRMLGA